MPFEIRRRIEDQRQLPGGNRAAGGAKRYRPKTTDDSSDYEFDSRLKYYLCSYCCKGLSFFCATLPEPDVLAGEIIENPERG